MRVQDWSEGLDAIVADYSASTFEWGRRDCVFFVLDVIRAVSGRTLYEEERGRYADARAAQMRLAAHGFSSPEDVVAAHCPRTDPALARDGDIGVVQSGKGTTLALFHRGELLGWTIRGLHRYERSATTHVYLVE